MIRDLGYKILSALGSIGANPTDSDDVRLHKSMLVMSTVMFIAAGLLWGLMYFCIAQHEVRQNGLEIS